MQLPQCTVCTPQAANWIRTTVWNSMFAYVFHWFLYEPVGQHTTTMRLAYNNWCHFRRCVCHEQLLTMKWELMLLPNHSHHDCPGCPSEFHQRACCSGGGGSAAGTLGTFFRPPNNYASGVIHSFLLCSSSFVRLLMYGSASVQAMGGAMLWPLTQRVLEALQRTVSLTAGTRVLKTDSLPRISFSFHIYEHAPQV